MSDEGDEVVRRQQPLLLKHDVAATHDRNPWFVLDNNTLQSKIES